MLSHYAPPSAIGLAAGVASGEAVVVLAHQERKARYRLDVCDAKRPSAIRDMR